MINHVGVKMKQPVATASYNNRPFEGRARSGLRGPLYWDSACFVFFRLALKINARGGRETEKLIIVPLGSDNLLGLRLRRGYASLRALAMKHR